MRRRLFAPVDISSLVIFRIAFGVILLWEVRTYFVQGWIGRYWIDPPLNFTYFGFGWVQPWPGNGMYYHWLALGILAFMIMVGAWYRQAATLFFLGFTYQFLLEQARYLNHFYLVSLVSFLLIFVPAHRDWSVDAWRKPGLRSRVAPAWALWLMRFQIGMPYFYGGLAKMNPDWFAGEPARGLILLNLGITNEFVVYIFVWGGFLFDLLVVPALLWRRTRAIAYVFALVFNLTNAIAFNIGIFPWFMIAATTMFFEPSWARPLFESAIRDFKGWTDDTPPEDAEPARVRETTAVPIVPRRPRLVLALLGLWVAVQVLFPFRHFLIPGNVNWTEEGHLFSWHMLLRSKDAKGVFHLVDPDSRRSWRVNPMVELPSWQAAKMMKMPEMILQYAHHLADEKRKEGYENVEVRVDVLVALNGRPPQRLIDPTVDLVKQKPSLGHKPWILPLEVDIPVTRKKGRS